MTSTLTSPRPAQTPKYPAVRNFIGGRFVAADAELIDVPNPSDGTVISQTPLSGAGDVDCAVRAASAAAPAWSATPIKERVQIFYRYRSLLEEHLSQLAELITEEHGKLRSEAEAEIL